MFLHTTTRNLRPPHHLHPQLPRQCLRTLTSTSHLPSTNPEGHVFHTRPSDLTKRLRHLHNTPFDTVPVDPASRIKKTLPRHPNDTPIWQTKPVVPVWETRLVSTRKLKELMKAAPPPPPVSTKPKKKKGKKEKNVWPTIRESRTRIWPTHRLPPPQRPHSRRKTKTFIPGSAIYSTVPLPVSERRTSEPTYIPGSMIWPTRWVLTKPKRNPVYDGKGLVWGTVAVGTGRVWRTKWAGVWEGRVWPTRAVQGEAKPVEEVKAEKEVARPKTKPAEQVKAAKEVARPAAPVVASKKEHARHPHDTPLWDTVPSGSRVFGTVIASMKKTAKGKKGKKGVMRDPHPGPPSSAPISVTTAQLTQALSQQSPQIGKIIPLLDQLAAKGDSAVIEAVMVEKLTDEKERRRRYIEIVKALRGLYGRPVEEWTDKEKGEFGGRRRVLKGVFGVGSMRGKKEKGGKKGKVKKEVKEKDDVKSEEKVGDGAEYAARKARYEVAKEELKGEYENAAQAQGRKWTDDEYQSYKARKKELKQLHLGDLEGQKEVYKAAKKVLKEEYESKAEARDGKWTEEEYGEYKERKRGLKVQLLGSD
ncbi:hypothetical protein BJ508DRAFT_380486 [Ascobolus immersus RN42]|uniref:Uncharacterized protein n=1 Tax=Ascobolus immersus RN42 TaxID=1160509 RepID=A0A3N4HLL5_ASCIM|nr:hypothetical protein BJ508DRAFT_380486 [Ascobolus immersus RN42]